MSDDDRLVEITLDHYSVSSLKSWLTCGEQFRLEKIVRVVRRPAVWLMGGTAFHTSVENFEFERFNGTSLSRDDVKTIFLEEFSLQIEKAREEEPNELLWYVAGRRGKNSRGQDIPWWKLAGPEMIDAYFEHRKIANWEIATLPDGSPALEIDIEARLSDKILVKAFIDAVRQYDDGWKVIVDYKTGSRKEESPLQLGVYRVGLWETLGMDIKLGNFYHARAGDMQYASPADLTGYTRPVLDREFRMLAKAIENGIYIPHRGSLCKQCVVKDYCPAVNGKWAKEYADIGFPKEEAR